MAHRDHKGFIDSLRAASAVTANTPVEAVGSSSLFVLPLATNGREPHGLVDADGIAGGQVTIYGQDNIAVAIAAASVGAGADVGVASVNGALGPVAGASGITRFRVGKTREAAAAGDRFSLYVSPRQLSNLI